MPRALRIIVVVIAFAVVVFTFKYYFSQTGGPAGAALGGGPAFLAGAPAQSYPVTGLDGKTDSLEHYRGQVVFVNLWASWCAPCRSETPALEQLYEAERGKGLVVLGIDQGESRSAAAAFASEMKLRYPILLDENQAYGRAYAAIGLPTSIVVGRDGRIVRGIDGELTLAQMREAVAPVLHDPQ
jgi:thiol-disulfide isomerase/thioredoxin